MLAFLVNAYKRHQLRANMRETAHQIDAVLESLREIPSRRERALSELRDETERLHVMLDELTTQARRLREDEFWLGRKRSYQTVSTTKELYGPAGVKVAEVTQISKA